MLRQCVRQYARTRSTDLLCLQSVFHSFYSTDSSYISPTQSYLRNVSNGSEIFLIGTAHVSKHSVEEVRQVVRRIKPDVVFLELCTDRAAKVQKGETADFGAAFNAVLAKGNMGGGDFVKLYMAGIYGVLKYMGMNPGEEFKAAMEEARAVNSRLVYGDRPIDQTINRLTDKLSMKDFFRLFTRAPPIPTLLSEVLRESSSFEDRVEAMKSRSTVRQLLQYMREAAPVLHEVILQERDEYMAKKLGELQGRVVAVVGMAHLDGIEAVWNNGSVKN